MRFTTLLNYQLQQLDRGKWWILTRMEYQPCIRSEPINQVRWSPLFKQIDRVREREAERIFLFSDSLSLIMKDNSFGSKQYLLIP